MRLEDYHQNLRWMRNFKVRWVRLAQTNVTAQKLALNTPEALIRLAGEVVMGWYDGKADDPNDQLEVDCAKRFWNMLNELSLRFPEIGWGIHDLLMLDCGEIIDSEFKQKVLKDTYFLKRLPIGPIY